MPVRAIYFTIIPHNQPHGPNIPIAGQNVKHHFNGLNQEFPPFRRRSNRDIRLAIFKIFFVVFGMLSNVVQRQQVLVELLVTRDHAIERKRAYYRGFRGISQLCREFSVRQNRFELLPKFGL